jgi:hypothetical protein
MSKWLERLKKNSMPSSRGVSKVPDVGEDVPKESFGTFDTPSGESMEFSHEHSMRRETLSSDPAARAQLGAALPADFMSEEPCHTCGAHERWEWLDGRALCRVCLVLDLMPMTLVLKGTVRDQEARRQEGEKSDPC